ncbi:T9SS type A sorting domain-containing protein [Marixanthomonas ophiurae]|uniref:T9SS C-terminal target domain-containing protein n=1 Tax=Marixanthomonas ophiurae TaxID=387659 RepID=A0A3E1Q7S6_9FLAO|nr:T9SS type A sorting domain-containing protein [Marixanthomonas ophiurae]RFN58189.1 T9SS C-terminal target domain-containing protein [Marixanthomonas ophiurae]
MKLFYSFVSFFTSFASLFLISSSMLAQDRNAHREIPDDAYIPISRSSMEKSPAYQITNTNYFTRQVNVDANGNDMIGDAANEPSIAVDPTNPDRIVIGWRHFETTSSNFRQAGYGYSTDGGITWTFPGVLDPGNFRSDPVLDFDAEGNFYYNSLMEGFECEVFEITDGGVIWEAPVPANGGDKQWMRIDRTGGVGDKNNYSYWNSSISTCSPGFFTRSIDGSETFEECVTVDGDPYWGTLAVNKNGILYLTGTTNNSNIVVAKSTTAKDPAITPVTWDSFSPVDLDGRLTVLASVNPAGLMGQAWVDVDISNGPGEGNVYVAASVERSSNNDPSDVMFAKSTDDGETFSTPLRINQDDVGNDAYQWFGTMAVAPNGRIDIVWLDTRNAAAGTNDSELFYSYSEDQGETWSDNEAISIAFDPNIGYPQQDKMGDYFDLVSDNDFAHLAWANTINGGQDVYYTRISPEGILNVHDITSANLKASLYPNPITSKTILEFFVEKESKTRVEVYDILGRSVNILLNKTTLGKQKIIWSGINSEGIKLSSGLYFITIETGNKKQTLKAILR